MKQENLEKKLNKHKKKQSCKLCNCKETQHSKSITPIEESPPYRKESEPSIPVGSLVTWKKSLEGSQTILEETKSVGIVVDSHWFHAEESAKFSKRKGEWISSFVSIPEAAVLWDDGELTNVPMSMLEIEDGT